MQVETSSRLPDVDSASAAHTERCAAFIRGRIAEAGGSVSFAEYMQHALYAPGLGYYAAGATKLGEAGDFITAPELSPLFGSVIARQCAGVLDSVGGGSILELGAGSGKLAIDVLKKLSELKALPDRYLILEVSAELAERQRAAIETEVPELAPRVTWLAELPTGHRGVILANEVIDALPVERFVRRDSVRQLRVTIEGDTFRFVEADAPRNLESAVAAIEADLGNRLAEGYVSEVSLGAAGWLADVLASLDAGIALLFDYGLGRREYYAPDRNAGWLRCHFRHHAHSDPLILAGVQDITAWVDFSLVAAAAIESGSELVGYTDQASFLIGGGLEQELAGLASLAPAAQAELSRQVKVLTLPGEMGERFKCLGIRRGEAAVPGGFAFADRTHTL